MSASSEENLGKKYEVTWQQTMLRIYDPEKTIEYYKKNYGMINIHTYHFNEHNFSLYFLITPPYDEEERKKLPEPNTPESEKYLWNLKGVALELTHNHNSTEILGNGNTDKDKGFGHIAFNCENVNEFCDVLLKNNVKFHKLPHEGRMKTVAFALDPNNYFIEIVKRSSEVAWKEKKNITNFSQTMIRVKNPEKSLHFYINILGMNLVHIKRNEDFTLYFLNSNYIFKKEETKEIADISGKVTQTQMFNWEQIQKNENNIYETNEAYENFKQQWHPVLELTHNHGTEKEESFSYHNGNTEPRGFGHIGFLVNDLESYCNELEKLNIPFKKKIKEGMMHNIAFIFDPDNYLVELVQRDTSFVAK